MGSSAYRAIGAVPYLFLRRREPGQPEPGRRERDCPEPGPPAAPRAGRRPRWWIQFPVVAALLWAVDVADKFRPGAQLAGLAHAPAVESISGHLGGGIGLPMNHWLATHPVAAAMAAVYYIVPNVAVTGAAGLMLLLSRPPRFSLHRNALIVMGLIALVAWWVYPVAPPRMLHGYDDITAAAVPVFSNLLEGNAADQFAALPSIHVAWALWVAVAAQALLRRPFWRAAVWIYPALTMLDVLATANHYMLDVVTAPAVLLLAYALAAAFSRMRLPRARRCRRNRRVTAGGSVLAQTGG